MRRICSLLLVLALDRAALAAEDVSHRMKAGESFVISSEENVSTGYSWTIDADASRGLERLHVEDGGATPVAGGEARIGAPSLHRWIVRALAPGEARLVQIYRRPWEKVAAKRIIYNFEISPRTGPAGAGRRKRG